MLYDRPTASGRAQHFREKVGRPSASLKWLRRIRKTSYRSRIYRLFLGVSGSRVSESFWLGMEFAYVASSGKMGNLR